MRAALNARVDPQQQQLLEHLGTAVKPSVPHVSETGGTCAGSARYRTEHTEFRRISDFAGTPERIGLVYGPDFSQDHRQLALPTFDRLLLRQAAPG